MLAVVAVLATGACRRRETPADTLVVVIETPVTTADPRFAINNFDSKVTRLVYAGITAVDTESLEPRLELAAAVTVIDPLTVDVTLRPGLQFSDGTPLTAADVARTYASVLAPDSTSVSHKNLTERYRSVTARGALVARFALVAPLGTLMSDLDFGIVSATGVGAGPYILRELTSTHLVLDTNPHYFGTHPALPHVEIKFVRDAAARLLMLVGGSADLTQNGIRMDLLDQIQARPSITLATTPSVILTYLMMNNTDPALRDVRVRQAIALAIDRPSIIASKFGGRARLATGLLPDFHWGYEAAVPRYDHDVARAKQLLDAAGFSDPDSDGPRPRLALTYKTSSDSFRVALARTLAAQLSEVGIAVEVRSFEFATFFADVKKGQFQLASMQTAELTEPDYYYAYFHSSRIPSAANPDGGNRWRYSNARVDTLTSAGRAELDRDRRKVIYSEVQKLVAADVPIVPLWFEDNVVVAGRAVRGYRLTPNARFVGLISTTK